MISRVADPSPSPLPRLPQWMNDIEKDRRYDGISSHLQNLFPVNYFGMLMESGTLVPQYRKNLFHLVAFLDVSNPLSGNVCEGLREILDSGEAVRLGVVAYSQSDLQSRGGARDGDDGFQQLLQAFIVIQVLCVANFEPRSEMKRCMQPTAVL